MMDKLLDAASKVSDQAEVFSLEERENGFSYENGKLKDIDSSLQSGMSLRIIKDEKVGFACTKNLLDREGFLQNALDSLKGGAEAPAGFPITTAVPSLNTFDPSIESLTGNEIVEECQRICDRLAGRTVGQVNLRAERITRRIRLLNSRGTDLVCNTSYYHLVPIVLYPGSYAHIHRHLIWKSFRTIPDDILDHIVRLFAASEKEAKPRSGRMNVLFLPETLYVLMWRLQSATSGRMLYQKESPLIGKIGERMFDEKLTIRDEPLNDGFPGARAFDDEATPCRSLPIVEKGVLKNYYYDLFYAKKLGAPPTGHGYKRAMWGGETISLKPEPSLGHLLIEPGDLTLEAMIRSIHRGIIVGGALGAHTGNIPNGDYSIGLSPGLSVEGGEIAGHVKDAMVAGNIYETLKHVIAIENTHHAGPVGRYPAILFDDVNVATKRG
jgi:PmbA protein